MENLQTILVTGATGHQGGAVARHLLRRGTVAVRALVRDANDPAAQKLKEGGAELVEADLDDRPSLDRALRGVAGVFSVQGLQKDMAVEVRQGVSLADAAQAAGVAHFVYSSVGGAERHTGIPHFDSKFQIEEHVRAIGLPYTILRPVFFLFDYDAMRPMIEKGTLSLPLSPDRKLQQLSEDDYGRMAAEVFARPADFLGRAEEVASVDPTMAETAAAFGRALGKDVRYQQTSFEAFQEQAGEEQTTMFRWLEDVGYDTDWAQMKRDFGEPTGFEVYLRDHGWVKSAA